MRRRARFARALPFLVLAVTTLNADQSPHSEANRPAWLQQYREPSARLIGEALGSTFAWHRLAVLTDTIGHRLSGSPALERAIQWAVAEMKRDGLENVRTERVMVPKWVRGQRERRDRRARAPRDGDARTRRQRRHARAKACRAKCWSSTASRNSTRRRARRAAASCSSTFRSRATARPCASGPPGRRARRGTARSRRSSARSDRPGCARRIPARCSTRPTRRRFPPRRSPPKTPIACSGWRTAATQVVVRLKMEAHFEADAESANVVGEIRGRELPDEVVVVGGHLDSWDVGAGATDDGGGCVVTWEALRLMKKLNLRPRRTVRVVLFTNEENGGRGGLAYRDQHRAELAKHVMMLESDGGVFRPLGVRLHRQRCGARHGESDRHAARAASPPTRSSARRRRRRHRPERAGGAHPGDVARRRRIEILPDPPHPGRHDRQDRSGRDGKMRRGGRGDGVCHRRPAAAARPVADRPL